MKHNKGREIFKEATVQCQHCGRYFVRPLAHKCNTGYRKHKQKWLHLTEKAK
jgi:uncharacterized OB-fold protein